MGELISLHGGHSGEFCRHAENSLADIVAAYDALGFSRVGITEHMPPADDRFLYPDEQAAGLSVPFMESRFETYITTCRRLQESYASRLQILVGFETETYDGSLAYIRKLMELHQPDYIVGSVHHVHNINFDFDEPHYHAAVRTLGGIESLYLDYFDAQYEMITSLQPRVVGHFDLVRLHDPDYRARLMLPHIEKKIDRNLSAIKDLGLLLDFNMRALVKGASEPYLSRPILQKALKLEIPVVPGDDSHGIKSVGCHIREAVETLEEMGFPTRWEDVVPHLKHPYR